MKRRDLVLASGAWSALVATRSLAQTARRPKLIGWLFPFSRESQKRILENFKSDMKQLGQLDGSDFTIEGRWSPEGVEALPALARELVALKPAVIVTGGTAAIAALKNATTSIPIVFASAGDPVRSGFVASLSRPGSNITGVMLRPELNAKIMEQVREALPAVRRIALLQHETDPVTARLSEVMQEAANVMRYELATVRVTRHEDFERAFGEAAAGNAGAMIVPPASFLIANSQRVGELAIKMRLPLFSTWPAFTRAGGLLSYHSDFRENFRRSAVLVDKILKGASPAELPVEQPDRYTLTINMRSARTLGIKIPQAMLLRADEVIE